jgi:hypothetical protein
MEAISRLILNLQAEKTSLLMRGIVSDDARAK